MKLKSLARSIASNESLSLKVLFSAKTHKQDFPLCAVVWEKGHGKALALFLQQKLKLLVVGDPCTIKISDEILQFLKANDEGLSAFSIDIKDLFYSRMKELLDGL